MLQAEYIKYNPTANQWKHIMEPCPSKEGAKVRAKAKGWSLVGFKVIKIGGK